MTGGLDWIYQVPKDQADKLVRVRNLTVVKAETMRVGWLVFDAAGRSGENPFQDIRVRRAVAHAIDRASICRNLVGGQSRVIHSFCFPTQFGCTDDVMKKLQKWHDKARTLSHAVIYGGSVLTGILIPAIGIYRKAVLATLDYSAIWQGALIMFAIVASLYLFVLYKRWYTVQRSRRIQPTGGTT